jgi:predicted transcriptional regulator
MNIQKILSSIKETGISDLKIAALVGTSQPQIFRIRKGQNPRYELGEKIGSLGKEIRPDIFGK